MVSDIPANMFAAGDSGLRSFVSSEKTHSTANRGDIAERLSDQHAVLFTLLPNGRLQQIYGTDDTRPEQIAVSADYCALCWRVLTTGKPAFDAVPGGSMLAAPVRNPLLAGYPGLLMVTRTREELPFTSKDFDAALGLAKHFEGHSSAAAGCGAILIDAKLKPLLHECGMDDLDPQTRSALLDDAKSRLGKRARRTATRLRLRDRRGIVRNYRVEQRKKMPIGDGTLLVYTRVPTIADWSSLDDSAFANTAEIARLMPALKFMIAKYASLPGLTQIAAKAKLSPYHFHREFSALLGISPKHLMLDCQVESAGRQLERGEVELVDIARSCGFAHQSHFTSRFKQATGLTPTAWRRAVHST